MKDKPAYFYPLLIFFIWLITYIVCTVLWEQKIGWDEVSYLTCARGIAKNFDFSSRTTTVMGLIKYAFPQHTHHYPIYSAYIAIFFKLFGVSVEVAYFSTWIAALITCLFVYFTMLLMTENNKIFSSIVGIVFLFLPRIVDYCDSAMMEVPCCALVSVFAFFIFKSISKGKLNPFFLGIAAIWLYFFKSLFIGVVIGFLFLIGVLHKVKQIGIKLKSTFSFLVSFFLYLGTFSTIYFIFTKFIFLPLAPMMNFDRRVEDLETYADFAAGFFNNPLSNILLNLKGFYESVIRHYYPHFDVILIPDMEGFYDSSPSWCEFGMFFLIFFYVIVFTFLSWKRLSPVHRAFNIFTITSVLSFNIIFNLIATSSLGIRSRYNLIYVPLLLISSAICLWANRDYFKPFILENKKGGMFVLLSFLIIVYCPFFCAAVKVAQWNKDLYHNIAHANSEIVKKFIKDDHPMFIYFHTGTHTTWDSFPTRVILMEATNDQIKIINVKLPRPIEYLFLHPNNNLFKINQNLILNGEPIIDNQYTLFGVDPKNRFVVYRYNPETNLN